MREDPLGGYLGDFTFEGSAMSYNLEGDGRPVLITRDLSARAGSYDWRYIFDCLTGTHLVYGLDVMGSPGARPRFSPRHYSRLIETFIREVIRERASIISGPVEAASALQAAFEAPRLVDRVIVAYPDTVARILIRGTIAGAWWNGRLGLPRLESIPGTKEGRQALCTTGVRQYSWGVANGGGRSGAPRFCRSGYPPGGRNALRFCDDATWFLG